MNLSLFNMTIVHWIVVAIFVLIFLILLLLSLKEKNSKTFFSMVFSSFLVVSVGAIFSIFILDKYTKKAELLYYNHKIDFRTESVKVDGKIKNNGKFRIGYCNAIVRISNHPPRGSGTKSFFKSNNSITDIFSSKPKKKNLIEEELLAITDLPPKQSKRFYVKLDYPTYFENPKFNVKINCH